MNRHDRKAPEPAVTVAIVAPEVGLRNPYHANLICDL